MKKKLFTLIFLVISFSMLAGCVPGSPIQKSNTPAPNVKGGTPAPDGAINVPGVTIQVYAPGPNPLLKTPDAHGHTASILLGLWHGVISPITLIASLFYKDVQIYEVHNDGSQYNLGFLLGVAVLFILMAFTRRR